MKLSLSPTAKRGWLYFTISVLGAFTTKVVEILVGGAWPSVPLIIGTFLVGITQGLIAVRAYIDGSAERYKQEAETDIVKVAKTTETVKVETSTPPPVVTVKEN